MLPVKYAYVDNIDIELTDEDVQAIAISGTNDAAVAEVAAQQYVIDQFKNYTVKQIKEAVNGYGCELKGIKRQKAIEYAIWIAAWNISEGQCYDVEVA